MTMGIFSTQILRLSLIPVTAVMLAGCEEGAFNLGGGKATEETSETAMVGPIEFEERDVEAPDVFQETDKALWDGRPSLGGVWIAHPNNKQPERVMIVNNSNGKFVVGALFRRDATAPGPKLQLSSDAASALGVLAGAPTELTVTALRRETVQVSVNETPTDAEPGDGPEDVAQTALAAIDASADTDAKPDQKGDTKAAPTQTAASKPVAKPTAAPAKPVVAAVSSANSALSAPFIQIGFYSVEANAKAAASTLGKKSIAWKIAPTTIKGKTFWRVLAGPAANKSERNKILKSVKDIGYGDAYAVKG